MAIALAVVGLGFAILATRFLFLQVIAYEDYHSRAEQNRIAVLPLAPQRGLILDRNGVVLARNVSGYALEVTPGKVDDLDQLIDELSMLVEITERDRLRFARLMAEAAGDAPVPLRTRLTHEEAARFAVHRYRYLGRVDLKARLFRHYPGGEIASHVVGYMGRITEGDEQALREKGVEANYRATQTIGKTGIEASHEDYLHGMAGFERVEIDAGGRLVRVLSRTPPHPGKNVVLTLDDSLQRVAEQALGERRGAVVALDPSTGAVLALVSRPGYDPNLFVDGIDPEPWNALNRSPDRPLLNRAIAGIYPPGSTFKPFMALAALELGARTESHKIRDTGSFWFGGRRYRTASKPGGHGVVDLFRSIVVSSDVYYYQLANDLGIDAISTFMQQFGFGSRTGIEIQGEASGTLPSREWKRKRFRSPSQQVWFPGETISIGIGQGYNAYTPMQLAQATATLVNGGFLYRPHLVARIVDPRTGERIVIERELVRRVPLDREHVRFVKRAMAAVNSEGTAAGSFHDAAYSSGGKTGTAQVIGIKQNEKYDEDKLAERYRDHSWFIAFAPLDEPRIALAVLVENGGYGSRSAAPIARILLDHYILGKEP